MIQSLSIRNIVLIEQLTIPFHPGMQVMTGETGAGKSIVVDAVKLALGERADRGLIRTGEDRASVEAVFDVPENAEVSDILQREQIEYDGSSVTVYREITSAGKNLCRVCGVIVPLSLLRELGPHLMDIHGQHEHQFLMDPDMHLQFLDRLGDESYRTQLSRTGKAAEDFLAVHRKYAQLRKSSEEKKRRTEELEKNLNELHKVRLRSGEEEELREESLRLRNSEKISSALRSAGDAIALGENGKSALESVRAASVNLSALNQYGEKIKGLSSRCENIYYELEEVSYEINRLLDENDHDPNRLERVEERLDLIRRIERKYGENIETVLENQNKMELEYEQLCSLEDRIEETAGEHRRLLSAYRQEARTLSEMRHSLAAEFEDRMMDQLKDLGMSRTVFRVAFAPEQEKKPMPRPVGDDVVEFMISTNPGEPLKPMARIASGGELSRIMLALKTLESDGKVDCMVFDEIDTGISGRMAQAVAEKMKSIAQSRQVICVTHLPQIAAMADRQYMVEKNEKNGRTVTAVKELDSEERIREIARMVGGAEGSAEDAEKYARTMIHTSGSV